MSLSKGYLSYIKSMLYKLVRSVYGPRLSCLITLKAMLIRRV